MKSFMSGFLLIEGDDIKVKHAASPQRPSFLGRSVFTNYPLKADYYISSLFTFLEYRLPEERK